MEFHKKSRLVQEIQVRELVEIYGVPLFFFPYPPDLPPALMRHLQSEGLTDGFFPFGLLCYVSSREC